MRSGRISDDPTNRALAASGRDLVVRSRPGLLGGRSAAAPYTERVPEHTRRSARAAAAEASPLPDATSAPHPPRGSRKAKRPLLKSFRLWVPVGILLLLIAGGVAAWFAGTKVVDQAFAARDALQQAIPLATTAKDQIMQGDSEGAQATVAELETLTAEAREQADGQLWRLAEKLPVVGGNLTAVRTVAGVVDDLTTGAVEPATQLSIKSLAPVDGRIDTSAITQASVIVDQAADAIAAAGTALAGIDRTDLISQVDKGVQQLDDVIAELQPLIEPARATLNLLPGLLGADAPRNYLVLVQNNAESRGTGGNPAALVMIHVDNGALSIAQQASSGDFKNGRPNPVTDLDPATVALYGDKVGRYMQDVTTTPDFTESARIMGAYWAESFGTPIDATLSIDPVALSYLMAATGPVTLPGGDVLTPDNVVSTLLNGVYFRYSDGDAQDAYFAMAAGAVFNSLTSVQDPRALVDQVVRAADEGRILYVPSAEAEIAAIAGSRLSGRLPADNAAITMVGSYINDITEGKLDYYLDTAVTVHSDVCTVDAATAPTFTVDTTLTSTLQPGDVAGLATYISPARFFPKGDISTDLVVYGPVGASFVSATFDGSPVAATPIEHLGRPAVKINVLNLPASAHTVSATFTGQAGATYAPIQAWHTPMVHDTPVTVDAAGCAPQE